MSILKTKNMGINFGNLWAVRNVNFEIGEKEIVGLIGPNGSGKTTFILHLNGLLKGEGDVTVCGLRVEKKNLPEIRRKVGIVFQDPDEQLFMPTVMEDVTFGLLNLGVEPREAARRAGRALEWVGMSGGGGKAPYHLSAGEKRRVALAGVLVMEPEILVLDEPTTFLDPPGQAGLSALLESLPQAKLLVSHDTAFVGALATRAIFFEEGRIVADGEISGIVRNYHWRANGRRAEIPGSS